MKKILLILLAILMFDSLRAQDTAFSYTYMGTTLYYTISNSQAAVVAPTYPNIPNNVDTVNVWAGFSKPQGAVVIPDSVSFGDSNYAVTVISNATFNNCDSITGLTLPGTLQKIGSKSLQGCRGLTFIDIPEGTSSILSYAFNECAGLQRVSLPSTLLSLGSNAFFNCRSLDTVSLPGSLRSVGSLAFGQCSNLKSVILHEGTTTIKSGAFLYCLRLNDIRFPSTLTSIGQAAFAHNISLGVVTLPEGLVSLGVSAFGYCDDLRQVSLPSTLDTVYANAFERCDTLDTVIVRCQTPHGLDTNAFASFDATLIVPCSTATAYSQHPAWGRFSDITEDCSGVFPYNYEGTTLYYVIDSLQQASLVPPTYPNYYFDEANNMYKPWHGYTQPQGVVVVPDSVKLNGVSYAVTSVGDRAFQRCDAISSVVFPNTVNTLGIGAMAQCSALQSATLPSGLVRIDEWCFTEDTSLLSIDLPESVTSMGDAVFYECTGLLSATIPASVTSLGAWTFTSCKHLVSVRLPEALEVIGEAAFYDCPRLENINMPANLVEIKPWAFDSDTSLTEVILPEGFRTLTKTVFQSCTGLRHVGLPSTLDSVGPWTFYGCSSLDTLIFPDALRHIGKICMENCSNLTYCHLPEQLESMEEWLLDGTAMTTFDVPPHVTHIGLGVFAGCRNLHKVTMSAVLTALGDSVFIDGTPLDTLVLRSTTPPTVNESVFPTYTATLIVPCGAAEAYRQHPIWGRFSNITEDCNAIEENESGNVNIYVRDGRIVVDGAEGEPVQVYDMMGRSVSNQALPSGVYMVNVGTYPARKVVVAR